MKNVTIALDDEIHRRARIRAAEMGTSLSALVRDYLSGLGAETGPGGPSAELREMPLPFASQSPVPVAGPAGPPSLKGPEGQPYCVNGKWVWTKDGKPRQPGALRGKIAMADDFDTWPDGFIDAIYGENTEAANNWWKPFATPPKKPDAK
ncbi:MAG: hypothetical protein ABL909_10415 [Sphingopyxis sp.]